jgi:hypothetical protein
MSGSDNLGSGGVFFGSLPGMTIELFNVPQPLTYLRPHGILDTALCWGKLHGEAERAGEKLPAMDSLIAATAAVHGLVVVSRNKKDFLERCRGTRG